MRRGKDKQKLRRITVLLAASLFVTSHAVVGQQVFNAHLSGGSHVPAVRTVGSGDVVALLNGDTLRISGAFDRLTGDFVQARVHLGYAGQDGPGSFELAVAVDASRRSGTVHASENARVLTADQREAAADRRLYVNIETSEYPNGEIRGQLLPNAEMYFEAAMSGGEAVPSAFTTGGGGVVAELRDSILTISGSFGGMTTPARVDFLGGAHIHFTRFADSGNTIRFLLDVDYNADLRGGVIKPDSNSFRLDAFQYGLLLDRQWYADVHSLKFRLAELRGTLHPMSDLYFVGRMTGHNVVPPNESGASVGIVGGLLGDTLTLSGTFLPMQGNVDSLGESPAHVHRAPPGQVGPVEFPLGITLQRQNHGHFVPGKNRYVLDDEQVETLLAGGFYADVHSSLYETTGEVRGQILVAGNNPAPGPGIKTPQSGTQLYVRPDDPQALRVSWDPATDPDGDPVIYLWQLGQNESMTADSLIITLSMGSNTSVTLSGAQLDSLLGTIGMKYLQSRTLYHRLVTSDGAANDREPAHTLQVTRTSISELPQGSKLAAQVDPTRIDALADAIRDGEFEEVHGLLLIRDGAIVHESYFEGNTDYFDDQLNRVSPGDTLWDASMPHFVAGVTQSVTSAIVGIALEEYGLSADTPVYEILPAYGDRLTGSERDVTVRHLLTMTSGYDWDDGSDLERMWQAGFDFVDYAIGVDHLRPAGSAWGLNGGVVNVLMAIVDALSGNASEYIDRKLFGPLDITEYTWATEPGGLPEAGLSLFIRPRDLAKFAYVYLNEGAWNNEQIIPREWVEASLAAQVPTGAGGVNYGYLWWAREIDFEQDGTTRSLTYYAAEGAGGNSLIVIPRIDLSVVITQGNYGSGTLARSQIDAILRDYVLPATDLRNKLPLIEMEAPRDGDQPVTTQPLEIRAGATDPDGSIVKVDFFQGSLLIHSDSLAPYETRIDSAFSGCYTIFARATDDFGGVGTHFSRIKMGEGCVPGPYGIVPILIPGIVEAENYDVGGPDVSYYDGSRADNTGGQYRQDEGVDIGGEPGNHYVVDTENGEWLQFYVEAETTDDYDVIVRTASGQEPGTARVWVDSLIITDPVALTAEPADGSWRDTRVATVYLTEGFHRLRFIIEKGGFYLDHLRIVEASVAADVDGDDGQPVPETLALGIYPNPTSSSSTIALSLPDGGTPSVEIFDVIGRRLARLLNRPLPRGRHEFPFEAPDLPSGVYLVRLEMGSSRVIQKLVIRR